MNIKDVEGGRQFIFAGHVYLKLRGECCGYSFVDDNSELCSLWNDNDVKLVPRFGDPVSVAKYGDWVFVCLNGLSAVCIYRGEIFTFPTWS